ncbi:hypothetical protein Tco_1359841 [Tanacetum coccineum]
MKFTPNPYSAATHKFGVFTDWYQEPRYYIGSSGVDGPPLMPEDPYAYVVAAFQAPPSPDYVSGPEYPPFLEFVPKPIEDTFYSSTLHFIFQLLKHAPSAEETEPFETDESAAKPPPHPAYRVTAKISIRDTT